jgi:hypothetical protein
VTGRSWTLLACASGVVLAIASTYPLVLRLWDSVPTQTESCAESDGSPTALACADQLLIVWAVGEGGRRLYRDPLDVFQANIFHPLRNSLAYSESMLSAGALVAPLNAISGNPLFGSNVYYLATLVLSLLGCFLFVREITGDPRAGLVAGAFFALTADRWAVLQHLAALSVHWVPFVLFTMTRFLKAPSATRALWLAIALIVHAHSSAYYGLMLPVLLVPWAGVLLVFGFAPLRTWLAASLVVAAALAASGVGYLPYLAVREELGYDPVEVYSAVSRWYWGSLADPIGYARGLLSGSRDPSYASPLPIVLVLAAGAAAVLRRLGALRSRRAWAQFLALVALWLAANAVSQGPTFLLAPGLPRVTGPFAYLSALPGLGSMRNPQRFLLLASFAGSALIGCATAVLLQSIRHRWTSGVAVAALIALVLVDARTLRTPQPLTRIGSPEDVPRVYRWLADSTPPETAVLVLPYGDWSIDALAMFHSLYHRRRIMNGYSAVLPRFPEALNGFPSPTAMRALQDAGVRYVIVQAGGMATRRAQLFPSLSRPASRAAIERLLRRPDLNPRWEGGALVVEVPPPPSRTAPTRGEAVDPSGWQVDGSAPGAERAIDGDLSTHWIADVEEQDASLRIDLGTPTRFAEIVLELGAHMLEFPRSYSVWSSPDGEDWQRLVSNRITLPPFASYREQPEAVEVPIRVAETSARYVEIRVPKRETPFAARIWGVHGLKLYAAGAP